jgi:hypothetical protein
MLNTTEYKQFITTLLSGNKFTYKKVDCTELLIDALIQFKSPIEKYTKIPTHSLIPGYKIIFKSNILISKPKGVAVRNWILHLYDYSYCSYCNNPKSKNSFSSNTSKWNNVAYICIDCISKKSKIHKDANSDYYKLYQVDNADKFAAASSKRRATEIQATPKWLSYQQIKEINEFYTLAKTLNKQSGINYHVDHIVPLNGTNICGLHVPWNLQILTANENLHKSNKYEYCRF